MAMNIPADFFHTALQKVPYPVAGVNLDGTFVWVNDHFMKLTGYSEVELLSMKYIDITHHEDIGIDILEIEKVRSGKIAYYSMQKRYIKKSGDIIDVEMTVYRYPQNGDILMFISYSNNLMTTDVYVKKLTIEIEELKTKYESTIAFVNNPNLIFSLFRAAIKKNWGVLTTIGTIISVIIGWIVNYLSKGQ